MNRNTKIILGFLLIAGMCVGNYYIWTLIGWYNYILTSILSGLVWYWIILRAERHHAATAQAMARYNVEHRQEYHEHLKRMGINQY